MKKFLILLPVCMIFVLGAILQTRQVGYELVRNTASADTFTDYSFDSKPSTTAQIQTQADETMANAAEIIVYASDVADDATLGFTVYAYKEGGPAKFVAEVDAVVGALAVNQDPDDDNVTASSYWIDTLTVSDDWISTVAVADSGEDRIATMAFDLCGYKYMYIKIDTAPSFGSAGPNAIKVFYSYF